MNSHTERLKAKKESKHTTVQFRTAMALLMALAFLGGCNLAPKYKTPAMQIPATFKEIEGWKVAQPKDKEARGQWWEVFNDPQLSALESQVNVSNQTVKAAIASFLQARAVVKQARAAYFPTITAAPSATATKLSSSGNTFTGSSGSTTVSAGSKSSSSSAFYTYTAPLGASWEPDLWGATRNTVAEDLFAAQHPPQILKASA